MFCLHLFQILFSFSCFFFPSTTLQIADTVEKIKTATGIQNVFVTHNETIFELLNNGESRTYFSMVVPEMGFEYVIENNFIASPDYVVMEILGYVTFTFDDPLSSNQTLFFMRGGDKAVMVFVWHYIQREDEDYMRLPEISTSQAAGPPIITPITVFPNGTVWSFPLEPEAVPFSFPSLNDAPVYGTDKRIINLKLYWVDAIGPIRIKFPFSVSFLYNDSTGTTTVSPSTTDYSEVTTTKKGLFNEKWWLIVDINAILVMGNGVIIGILIYKLLRFNVKTKSMASSATLSTAASDDIATTEIPPRRL